MLHNAIHVAVAENHGVTLVKSSVGKRKREEVQEPVEEKEETVHNTCDGACDSRSGGFYLSCGHKFCFECMKERVDDGFVTCLFCDLVRYPKDIIEFFKRQ